MRTVALISAVLGASLLSACDIEGGDPVQHALRDASAARQAAALKTTEEQEAQAAQRATKASDTKALTPDADPLDRLIAARRQSVADTRALIATTKDAELKRQLTTDLAADEERLQALIARTATH